MADLLQLLICFQAFAFVWVLGETPGFIPSPHGRRWEMIQPKWVPAQPAHSLPSPGLLRVCRGCTAPTRSSHPPPPGPAGTTAPNLAKPKHSAASWSFSILSFLSKSVLVQYLPITIDGLNYIAVTRNNKSLLHLAVFKRPEKLEWHFTCTPGRGHTLNGYFEKH